ncbi:unnamed protein product, partial [Heterosigma akashiwo]
EGLRAKDPAIVPRGLPDTGALGTLAAGLPLHLLEFKDGEDGYLAVFEKLPGRALDTVLGVEGEVSQGYGRGGKKLGVPTANLPESLFSENLSAVRTGVYFGWA